MKFVSVILSRTLAGFILALAIPFGLCAQENVVVSYDGYAGFQGPLWATKDLELFNKYSLKAEMVLITGSTRSMAALISEFSFPPRVARDGIRNALELVSARDHEAKGEINLEQFIDESLIDELEKEGFFKRLR